MLDFRFANKIGNGLMVGLIASILFLLSLGFNLYQLYMYYEAKELNRAAKAEFAALSVEVKGLVLKHNQNMRTCMDQTNQMKYGIKTMEALLESYKDASDSCVKNLEKCTKKCSKNLE